MWITCRCQHEYTVTMLKIGKSPDSEHVRDCMTWHYGNSAKGTRNDPPKAASKPVSGNDSFFPSDNYTHYAAESSFPGKSGLGKSKSYGLEAPAANTAVKYRDEDGTVIQALRGWQGHGGGNQDASGVACCYDNVGQHPTAPVTDPSKDPYIADLLAHQYMQRDHNKSQNAAGSATKKTPVGKSGGKPTKTSQMRHVVNNERAHPHEQELWKMSKFTKGAKPVISTFRTPSGDKKKKSNGLGNHGDGACGAMSERNNNGAICTCGCEPTYNYTSGDLYNSFSPARDPLPPIQPDFTSNMPSDAPPAGNYQWNSTNTDAAAAAPATNYQWNATNTEAAGNNDQWKLSYTDAAPLTQDQGAGNIGVAL